jgi:MFS family permease
MLSGLMIALEFCPAARRPTYIGLNNTVWGTASGLAPVIGGWLADRAGYLPLFAVALFCGGMGYVLLHWSVREPRHTVDPAVLEQMGPI